MSDIAQELLEKFSDLSHPYNDRLHEIAGHIKSQAKRIEEFREAWKLARGNSRGLASRIRKLQTANTELKEQNTALMRALNNSDEASKEKETKGG